MSNAATTTTASLYLADGLIFKGKSFGAKGTVGGEICFNTGMTGYQEVFTDPSYAGQVLVMNSAYIGNYGIKESDTESNGTKISGLIAKNISNKYSRMVATDSLENYLIKNNIIAIYDIDTRSLVQHIRNSGAMNCIISTELSTPVELSNALNSIPDMAGLELASLVSTKNTYYFGDPAAKFRVAVMDYGVKKNILKSLADRNMYLAVFPSNTTMKVIEAFQPDGYFLSNGPGDPASMQDAVEMVRLMLNTNKPIFGICLGHQLLARANDIDTYKMHHGHRGLNHPVMNLATGKAEITTQNHGFSINPETIKQDSNIEITHLNLNDGSIEGIKLKNKPAFSVQYHPESSPGPQDSRYLFDNFYDLMHISKAG